MKKGYFLFPVPVLIASILLSALSALPADKKQASGFEAYFQKLGYVAIPLELKENKLRTSGRLNNRKVKIVVDTGCSITAVSTDAGEGLKSYTELGRRLDDTVLARSNAAHLRLVGELEIAGVKLQNQPVRVRGLATGGRADTDLILGMDFLKRYHCLIDCTDLRLYLKAEKPAREATDAIAGTLSKSRFIEVPVVQSQHLVLTCAGKVNGQSLEWLVDTGGVWTMVDNATKSRLGLPQEATGYRIVGVGSIGSTNLRVTEVKELQFGEARQKFVDVGVAELSNWQLGRGEDDLLKVDGILGMDQLVMNSAIIDCASPRLWFYPRTNDKRTK